VVVTLRNDLDAHKKRVAEQKEEEAT